MDMNEIVKQEDLINRISAQYKPYIEALRTPTLNHKDYVMVLKSIYLAIVNGMLLNGIGKANQDEGVIKYLSEKVFEQTKKKYPNSTVGQVKHAIEKYVLGEFADKFPKEQFISFNVANIFKSICLYQESNGLLAAKREWINLVELGETHIALEPKVQFEITKEQILSLYSDFLESGDIPVYAKVYYDAICEKKGVKTLIEDNEVRVRIRDTAKSWYENDLKSKKYHIKEPNNFKMLIETFCGQNRTYESVSKRFALKEYFNYCKLNNIEPI